LAGNEELFQKFAAMPNGVARARFIDRLDGRLEASSRTKKPVTVKPTPKLRGTTRKPSKNPEDMSQVEYDAYARKQGWL